MRTIDEIRMTTQKERFIKMLTIGFELEFKTNPKYVVHFRTNTNPKDFAEEIVDGLIAGTASKDGECVQSTRRALGIKNTYKAIKEFLTKE